ncbi:hypothetical protein OsI_07386 [Oryza sativa Indica Group]|uniref:Uncharacterized protein n=2 Tax=Oryza sativa TaxID=4530 RepID=A3A7B6_ORYSJ|nr:hypothetical protein OsI_07386 [Oryza sativa Indica Group]EAZ23205.1 hypothetical protein OsJ_06890 [Oryza sativa Japonica Group]
MGPYEWQILKSLWAIRYKGCLGELLDVAASPKLSNASQNLEQKLDCLGELMILGEAAAARSSPKQTPTFGPDSKKL